MPPEWWNEYNGLQYLCMPSPTVLANYFNLFLSSPDLVSLLRRVVLSDVLDCTFVSFSGLDGLETNSEDVEDLCMRDADNSGLLVSFPLKLIEGFEKFGEWDLVRHKGYNSPLFSLTYLSSQDFNWIVLPRPCIHQSSPVAWFETCRHTV